MTDSFGQLQEAVRAATLTYMPAYAESEKKAARIALCAAVQLFASCHQTRADAHVCLDHAFDAVRETDVLGSLARMEAALALVGNVESVGLGVASERAPGKIRWEDWRTA